jgi:hypothetical protein
MNGNLLCSRTAGQNNVRESKKQAPFGQERRFDRTQLALLECPTERRGFSNLKTMLSTLEKLYTTVMKKGIDYDTISGTPKPTLLKAGAELLVRFFELVPDTQIVNRIERTELEIPYFQYDAECRICNKYEIFLGNDLGSCNSAEPTYAFSWVFEDDLPHELKEKKDDLKNVSLNGRIQYRIESSRNDIFGSVNSIQKRAKKRAFVDAVLCVTNADRIFSQDLGEQKQGDAVVVGGGDDL